MRKGISILMLLVCLGTARAADDDPEPPAGTAQLRQIVGDWRSVRLLAKGKDSERTTLTYSFERDRFAYSSGKLTYKGTLKLQAKGSQAILELTRENSTITRKFGVKFEKGQLYLAAIRDTMPKEIDFTGQSYSVLVLKREKK